MILPVKGSSKTVLNLTREQVKPYRDKLLARLGIQFDAPTRVELYLFGNNTFAVENINEKAVDVTIDLAGALTFSKALTISENSTGTELSAKGNSVKMHISANTLIVVNYK